MRPIEWGFYFYDSQFKYINLYHLGSSKETNETERRKERKMRLRAEMNAGERKIITSIDFVCIGYNPRNNYILMN